MQQHLMIWQDGLTRTLKVNITGFPAVDSKPKAQHPHHYFKIIHITEEENNASQSARQPSSPTTLTATLTTHVVELVNPSLEPSVWTAPYCLAHHCYHAPDTPPPPPLSPVPRSGTSPSLAGGQTATSTRLFLFFVATPKYSHTTRNMQLYNLKDQCNL